MLPFSLFEQALPYDQFLGTFGSPGDKLRWDKSRAAVALSEAHLATLKPFTRTLNALVLAGAWCGDCSTHCPIFERFAEVAPSIQIRYLDRDAHPDAQKELQINGGNRVPVLVLFSEDGHEVLRYGERPLASYRKMGRAVSGTTTPAPSAEELAAEVTSDWLREFERAHLILRLSPRLRRLHGD